MEHTTVLKLKEYFSKYGNVEVVQMHSRNNGKPYVKIHFESFQQANLAMQGGQLLDDGASKHYIGDEFVVAKWFVSSEDRKRHKVMIFDQLLFVRRSQSQCMRVTSQTSAGFKEKDPVSSFRWGPSAVFFLV